LLITFISIKDSLESEAWSQMQRVFDSRLQTPDSRLSIVTERLKRAVGIERREKPFEVALRNQFARSLEHCDDPVRQKGVPWDTLTPLLKK
jgi:hypothetical protein